MNTEGSASASAEVRFEQCLAQTLKWEGGYSNNPRDPGGMTMKGIIQREYDAYRKRKGLPTQWVKKISAAEVEDIYRAQYWNAMRCGELPAGVNLTTFDYGVNSGIGRAPKVLQRIVGVAVTGKIDDKTISAVRALDPDMIVSEMMAERRRFLRGLKTFDEFGVGWMRRCDGIERVGLEWGGSDIVHSVPIAAPLPDIDAQADTQAKAFDDVPGIVVDMESSFVPPSFPASPQFIPPVAAISILPPQVSYTKAEVEAKLRKDGSRTIRATDRAQRWSWRSLLGFFGIKGGVTALGVAQMASGQYNAWRPIIDELRESLMWVWSVYQIVLPIAFVVVLIELHNVKNARISDEVEPEPESEASDASIKQ